MFTIMFLKQITEKNNAVLETYLGKKFIVVDGFGSKQAGEILCNLFEKKELDLIYVEGFFVFNFVEHRVLKFLLDKNDEIEIKEYPSLFFYEVLLKSKVEPFDIIFCFLDYFRNISPENVKNLFLRLELEPTTAGFIIDFFNEEIVRDPKFWRKKIDKTYFELEKVYLDMATRNFDQNENAVYLVSRKTFEAIKENKGKKEFFAIENPKNPRDFYSSLLYLFSDGYFGEIEDLHIELSKATLFSETESGHKENAKKFLLKKFKIGNDLEKFRIFNVLIEIGVEFSEIRGEIIKLAFDLLKKDLFEEAQKIAEYYTVMPLITKVLEVKFEHYFNLSEYEKAEEVVLSMLYYGTIDTKTYLKKLYQEQIKSLIKVKNFLELAKIQGKANYYGIELD